MGTVARAPSRTSMTHRLRNLVCGWQRNACMLIWVPVLLLGPVLDLHGGPGQLAIQWLLIATLAVTAVTVGLSGGNPGRRTIGYAALGVLAAATVAGVWQGDQWVPTWILLAIALPVVLPLLGTALALPLVAAGSMLASRANGGSVADMWSQGLFVMLSGVATAAVIKLIDVIDELRRTREELARGAVAAERERFSRDLHDLLGHTLSVMVVKAQAVRRLAAQDAEAAATHAADIEQVGRDALLQVRQAVDAVRSLNLVEELDGARRALDAAGVRTAVVDAGRPIPDGADQALAWVVREGATNVLRHSGAAHCSFEFAELDGDLVLTICDDGTGGPAIPSDRQGGLDGLRRRLVAAGGRLEARPGPDGFRLTARVPAGASR